MKKDRIEQRLKELGINQFEAAKRAGKNSNFIYDFLIGRKSSFKGDGPQRVAKALECTVEYLTGEQDTPGKASHFRLSDEDNSSGLQLVGAVETGAFRRVASLKTDTEWLPVPPSSEYPANDQVAYAVRGDSLIGRGIHEGAVLICLRTTSEFAVLKSGSIVIVESHRPDEEEIEISARELQYFPDRTELITLNNDPSSAKITLRNNSDKFGDYEIKIVAIAISANILF